MYTAIDCQGFAGGFTLGVVQAGFELIGKREMKGGFGVANCETNRHLLGQRWKSEAVDPMHWSVLDADLVFGNPPCSGFSVMSAKTFRGADSKINHCMWAFAEYAARVRPQIAIFESVAVARTSPDGYELMKALRAKVEELTGLRWTLTHVRHNAIHVGGAAERRRYFWVISRIPFGVEPIENLRKPVLSEVIGDLQGLREQTWEPQPYVDPATWWSAPRRTTSGLVDGHVGLDNPLTRRIKDLMVGITWEAGDHIGSVARKHYEKHGRLPDSWKATEQKLVEHNFFMGFTSPVRWHGDRHGRVITGGGLHNVVHYALDRTITHRETARILGFPDDWLIEPLKNVSGLNMTWGKGITVDCGRWIAQWARASLDGAPGSVRGDEIGDREFDVDLSHGIVRTRRSPGIVSRVKPHTPKQRGPVMTDETPAPASGRGRPRPQSTIDRDAKVLELIKTSGEGFTRAEIAEKLDLPGNEVYLSLYRLSRDGQIAKAGSRWRSPDAASSDAPAPAPQPEFTG